MKNDAIVRKIYRSFVMVSILTALTATLGMLIDNIIVGRFLGVNALGAMGVISPISLIFSAVGNICSGGGTARAAQALGKGDRRSVSNIFTITMLFVLVAGGLLTAAGMAFAPQIATLLGAKGDLHAPATEYLYGFFLGAIPTIMTTALMGFIKIDGSTRLPLLCIVVMTAANILLDLVMIFVFRMGMFGMALATSIAYTLAVLTGCTHFARKYCTLRWVRPENLLRELSSVALTGAPTALSRICDTIKVMTLNNLLVTAAGAGAVAALNVRTQTSNILGALIMGVCQAIIPVAGVFYGEEDRSALQSTLKEALRVGLCLSAAAALALLAFPTFLPGLLGATGEDVMAMAKLAVQLFAVGMPLQLMNMAMMNIYQATRQTGCATLICILQQLVFTTGFALLLVNLMGVSGVWLAFLLGEGCTLVCIFLMILWQKKGKIRSFADIMLLPDNFGGDPRDRLEIAIGNSMEEAVRVSELLYRFGEERRIDKSLMHRAALCVEEMAGNVIRHSFRKGEKAQLDLLLYNKPDRLVIRLRDSQSLFDPVSYLRSHDKDDDHLGLRIADGVADRFEYRRSIGLNNILLVLKKNV